MGKDTGFITVNGGLEVLSINFGSVTIGFNISRTILFVNLTTEVVVLEVLTRVLIAVEPVVCIQVKVTGGINGDVFGSNFPRNVNTTFFVFNVQITGFVNHITKDVQILTSGRNHSVVLAVRIGILNDGDFFRAGVVGTVTKEDVIQVNITWLQNCVLTIDNSDLFAVTNHCVVDVKSEW